MKTIYLAIPLVCLFASVIAGLFGKFIGRRGAHGVTIAAVTIAFALSVFVYSDVRSGHIANEVLYIWAVSGGIPFQIGFLIDQLSATMMVIVTFVSLMVHIYTIGYMAEDPGYQRFFCYISLFTFAMLMLVMSNNFLQLFFGWEAVGLVSYLLIGFWYDRDSAIFANMKAFLVNRVGDLGFLLGIAAVLYLFGSLDYVAVFSGAEAMKNETVTSPFGEWNWMTVTCILLFIGAMGKSAQVPLHVWLPDSMEGPTPISALIHAAFHGGENVSAFRAIGNRPLHRADHRCDHSDFYGTDRFGAKRYQESGRLFDIVTARIHDGRAWCLRLRNRNFSPGDPCLFQSAVIFRRRLRHYRHASRTGHA